MTTTPKSVILAVVLFLGVFALLGLAGVVFLIDRGHATGAEIALVSSPTVFALGALAGLLGSTRTTPELPEGAQLTGGAITLTTPTAAQNAGETFSGTPLAPTEAQPVANVPAASSGEPATEVDPATIPGYG